MTISQPQENSTCIPAVLQTPIEEISVPDVSSVIDKLKSQLSENKTCPTKSAEVESLPAETSETSPSRRRSSRLSVGGKRPNFKGDSESDIESDSIYVSEAVVSPKKTSTTACGGTSTPGKRGRPKKIKVEEQKKVEAKEEFFGEVTSVSEYVIKKEKLASAIDDFVVLEKPSEEQISELEIQKVHVQDSNGTSAGETTETIASEVLTESVPEEITTSSECL